MHEHTKTHMVEAIEWVDLVRRKEARSSGITVCHEYYCVFTANIYYKACKCLVDINKII